MLFNDTIYRFIYIDEAKRYLDGSVIYIFFTTIGSQEGSVYQQRLSLLLITKFKPYKKGI